MWRCAMGQEKRQAKAAHPFPLWGKALLVVAAVVAAFFLRQYIYAVDQAREQKIGAGQDYAQSVAETHPALQYFEAVNPGRDIFLACEEDLTDDGLKELVVIYHNPEEGVINWMVALINRGDGGYDLTEPTRAPIENQAIRFFNMDKEGELEFVLTGEKDGEVGYAIYRIIDGALINLFGEDMEDCC